MCKSCILWLSLFTILTNTKHIASNIHASYYIAETPTLHIAPNGDKQVTLTADWTTTVPFFPHYPTRTVQVLDGNWNYGYGGSKYNLNQTINPSTFHSLTPNITYVPSAFDVKMPGINGPRGTSFYRTTFDSTQGKDILVYFSACAFYCQLYFDGVYIGDHRAGGYQAFSFHITQKMMNISSSTHEIFVVVDNRYNSYYSPTYTGGDFYHFGGINRNVLIHTLNTPNANGNNALNRIEVFPNKDNYASGEIDVNITFTYPFISTGKVNFLFEFDANNQTSQQMEGSTSNGVQWIVINQVKVPDFKLWSIKSPNLHRLQVNYIVNNQVVDAIDVRFGIRQFGIDSKTTRITINGQIVKLHGFNRHTMYPDTGNALTYSQIQQDVSLIKEVGANYIRGAHYPQDQRYLDLLDENGIVLWSETLGPGVSTNDLNNPYWMQYQIQAVNEMLDAAINNPCIIIWAFYNEGPSNDKNAIVGYNASASAIRARDKTRFVSWADNKETGSVTIGPIADVASFNSYPAWYNSFGNINACYAHWNSMVADVYKNWPGKPFLISETGAGGVYEYDNVTNCKWSQLYESQVVFADAKVALNNSNISGITLWQFSDIKANSGDTNKCGQCDYYPETTICAYIDTTCGRPGGENHKGSIDFWRRYKQSFNTVQQLYVNFNETL